MGLFDSLKKKAATDEKNNRPGKGKLLSAEDVEKMGFNEIRAVIDRIWDQDILYAVVLKAPPAMGEDAEYVLSRAIPRIEDPELLQKIAMNRKASLARFTVNTGVLPQNILATVLKYGPDDSIKQDAAEFMVDQELIADVLIHQSRLYDNTYEYTPIVKNLIRKLNNPDLLKSVAETAESKWIRSFAQNKLETLQP